MSEPLAYTSPVVDPDIQCKTQQHHNSRWAMSSHNELNGVETLFQQIGEYAETRAELLKLVAVNKASEFVSSTAVQIAVYLIASRVVLLLSIAAALLLGEWLGGYSYGFFIVALAFTLAGMLVYLRRNQWVKDPVARLLIAKVLE